MRSERERGGGADRKRQRLHDTYVQPNIETALTQPISASDDRLRRDERDQQQATRVWQEKDGSLKTMNQL